MRVHLILSILSLLFLFLNLLPHSKHMHVLSAIPNVFFTKLEPVGKLSDMDLEDENAESFGAGRIEDFSWKQLLDLYTCTECGRCEVNCPAWQSDKPLNPKILIKDPSSRIHKSTIWNQHSSPKRRA
mgnify:CR=1 FL=1